ncbi:flagellar biosynthetic protein FliR [Enterovibrio norvegicus]|uniref:Flagellar biosynthetic protein FliR n=2 Tax=Enterovibrio norvegicus TaxID=188144 RepID=A0A1I5N3H4_9GAMM|nr:flagellar biosynthetic protein FliR [Enterovibrio norvegicus]OEE61938.1 flagellar biosynthetic protein FliR [Enterovibrio norvegicus]OEF58868.1 flagellar biosynthetic protein FliR [Enterovibrio norvegicus]OEF59563.1 flagellar biosynthetic protein FliR [Enterovibrio norvegicus]PMH65628.1 flagellar biosynthetic protein FliR [Enterovibrio norvegicus]TKF32107.1 flagellar type III secretion system protein FliR [Enterovibrio norvegicus]
MEFPATIILEWLAQFFWPLTRISSMMMTMTFFGARFVPVRVRLYLSLAITFAVMPSIPRVPDTVELVSLGGVIMLAQQILIGVAMGTVTQFIIQTFVLLGQILGMQSSLGFASMVDPANGQNTPLLGQLFMFVATMIFLATDGHLQMLNLVVMSFKSLPIGESLQSADFRAMASWFGIMFSVGLGMSLAGIIALLTVNLSFGIMTRAAPQLNIFSLGFSFALLVGLLICWYILSGILPHYLNHWDTGLNTICDLIRLDCANGGGA